MENKKLSSIEWLYERLERMIPNSALYNNDKKLYLEEAKERHEKEIIYSYIDSWANYTGGEVLFPSDFEDAEKYYNQNFNK